MTVFRDSETRVSIEHPRGLSPVQFAALATTLAVIGLSIIWLTMIRLWVGWTTDALKSIGMVVPLVSLILILRVWRNTWLAGGRDLVGPCTLDTLRGSSAGSAASIADYGCLASLVDSDAADIAHAVCIRFRCSFAPWRGATVSGRTLSHSSPTVSQSRSTCV